MKKENLNDDFEAFYMELPQADYLNDINIEDAYDDPCDDQKQGLSEEQVSEIARDSRKAAEQQNSNQDQGEQNLFSNDDTP